MGAGTKDGGKTAEEQEAAGAAAASGNGHDPAATADDVQDGLVLSLGGQLGFDVGGKKPTGSTIRIVGGKVDLEGQVKKGSTLRLEILVECGEVAFVDKKDPATGQTISCERRQKARIIEVGRVEE